MWKEEAFFGSKTAALAPDSSSMIAGETQSKDSGDLIRG
jgi:hypothetical protein